MAITMPSIPTNAFEGQSGITEGTGKTGVGHLAEILQAARVDILANDTLALANQADIAALEAAIQDRDMKNSVRVATTGALAGYVAAGSGIGKTFTAGGVGVLTIDGVATVLGDSILVKDEGSADNGIYTVTTEGTGAVAAVLTRRTDADEDSEVTAGMLVPVEEGTANADTMFELTTNNPIVVDTTVLAFSAYAGLNYLTADEKAGLSANSPTLVNPVQTLAEMEAEEDIRLAHSAKTNVRVLEAAPIAIATPGANLDFLAMNAGDRVLLTGQVAPAENGLWVWNGAAVPMTRPLDFIAGTTQNVGGCRVFIENGTFGGQLWYSTDTNPVDVDTDPLTFAIYPAGYVLDPQVFNSVPVILSAADLAALNATPITLVPAPGVGLYIEPISFTVVATYGTAAFNDVSGNGNFLFRHATSTRRIAEAEADGVVDLVAGTEVRTVLPERADIAVPTIQDVTPQNEGIEVVNNGTAFVDPGTSTTEVAITTRYRVLSLV